MRSVVGSFHSICIFWDDQSENSREITFVKVFFLFRTSNKKSFWSENQIISARGWIIDLMRVISDQKLLRDDNNFSFSQSKKNLCFEKKEKKNSKIYFRAVVLFSRLSRFSCYFSIEFLCFFFLPFYLARFFLLYLCYY